MTAANGTYDITARTWTHIKVLYILIILLSAVALALFIVCFMMVLEVQRGLNDEVSLRQEREQQFVNNIQVDSATLGKVSSQTAEILTTIETNKDKLILVDKDIKLSASTLTRFCASIHSHCPVQGSTGQQGPTGEQGPRGIRGQAGIPGAKGHNGEAGLTGPPGLSIKGDPGADGVKGATGLPGHDGRNGLTGLKGEKGAPGVKGPKGTTGVKGDLGNLGGPGALGVKGEMGPPGLPGIKGDKGEPGTGSSGFGLKGEKGAPGFPGLSGKNGLMGLRGTPGLAGPPGPPGPSGVAGEIGPPGKPGVAGPKGLTGLTGQTGHKGEPGDVLQCQCLEGPQGEKGDPGVCPNFDSCKSTEMQSDQPGPTPVHVLFQNSSILERKEDLTIKTIGKPVLYRNTKSEWGSWMVDSDPTPATKGKFYVTLHFYGRLVYEYDSAESLISTSGNYSKQYNLQDQYYGTGGVVYRGAFYYHRGGFNIIARYDLETRAITAQLPIEDSLHRSSESLFSTGYNYYDLAVDENGLWVAYAFKEMGAAEVTYPNSLLVAKLEPNYLDIEKTWNVTVKRKDYANSFIAHGILYLLDSATAKNTHFSFVYDLYSHSVRPVSIPFTNVFQKNRMLAYDHSNSPPKIMAWDNGRIVSYPVLTN